MMTGSNGSCKGVSLLSIYFRSKREGKLKKQIGKSPKRPVLEEWALMVLAADMHQQWLGKKKRKKEAKVFLIWSPGGKQCADCLQFAPDTIRAFPVSNHVLWLPGGWHWQGVCVETQRQRGLRAAEGASVNKTFFQLCGWINTCPYI